MTILNKNYKNYYEIKYKIMSYWDEVGKKHSSSLNSEKPNVQYITRDYEELQRKKAERIAKNYKEKYHKEIVQGLSEIVAEDELAKERDAFYGLRETKVDYYDDIAIITSTPFYSEIKPRRNRVSEHSFNKLTGTKK